MIRRKVDKAGTKGVSAAFCYFCRNLLRLREMGNEEFLVWICLAAAFAGVPLFNLVKRTLEGR